MPNNLKLAKQTKYPLRDQEKKGERIPTIIIIIYMRGRNCFLSKSIVNLNRFMFKKNHCSSRIEFLASIKILTRMYIKTLLPLRNNGGFNGTTVHVYCPQCPAFLFTYNWLKNQTYTVLLHHLQQ